jgi:hypothetical protein
MTAMEAVRAGYAPFGSASDILVTKVLLGVLGCIPAVDRFFVDGFRKSGRKYATPLNSNFPKRAIEFCNEYRERLRKEQVRIKAGTGAYYPLMKLVDMYFWQVGFEADTKKTGREPEI